MFSHEQPTLPLLVQLARMQGPQIPKKNHLWNETQMDAGYQGGLGFRIKGRLNSYHSMEGHVKIPVRKTLRD